jgi:hypothetical protein
MKKLTSLILTIAIVNLVFISCERPAKEDPPVIPSLETMAMDFSYFTADQKSATAEGTQVNFGWAAANIVVFNSILTLTLVVPVAAFANSFNYQPEFMGNATWQWEYDVDGWFGRHHARMTGTIRQNDVKWEMYISREGINPYPEFLWFEGTSALDGNSGQWVLNYSNIFQEPMLQIDWERTGNEIGEIQYTLVRTLKDDRTPNPAYGSYVLGGRTDAELDAYYSIYLAENQRNVDIEWSLTNYNGRIMDPLFFLDNDWHCWDNMGYDMVCE